MNRPTAYEIKAAYEHGVWLRTAGDLGSEARMLADLSHEVEDLRAWKVGALQIEASWDAQAVGKALGLVLGTAIRPQILPAIEMLNARATLSRTMLVRCHEHLGAEIGRKTLNESAADGTQALSFAVAALLDATT